MQLRLAAALVLALAACGPAPAPRSAPAPAPAAPAPADEPVAAPAPIEEARQHREALRAEPMPLREAGGSLETFRERLVQHLRSTGDRESAMRQAYAGAIAAAPTEDARAELYAEAAAAERELRERAAAAVVSALAAGDGWAELRAIVWQEYVEPKAARVRELLSACGDHPACAASSADAEPPPSACDVPAVLRRGQALHVSPDARDPFAVVTLGGSRALLRVPAGEGGPTRALVDGLVEPAYVPGGQGFVLHHRLDIVPGHLWIEPDTEVAAAAARADGTAELRLDLGRGGQPRRIRRRVPCAHFDPASRQREETGFGLGVGYSPNTVRLRGGRARLHAGPGGERVATVVTSGATERERRGGWVRVSGRTRAVSFDGWVRARDVTSAPSGGGGFGTGTFGLRTGARRAGRAHGPAGVTLPLRLEADGPVVATVRPDAPVAVVSRDATLLRVQLERLRSTSEDGHFVVRLADLAPR